MKTLDAEHSVNVSSILRQPPSFPRDGVLLTPEDDLDTIDFDHVLIYAETINFMYERDGDSNEHDHLGYIDPEDYIREDEPFHVDNEFEIDSAELEDLDSNVKSLTDSFRNSLLQQGIARHMAFDTASAEVEAVMKSQYGSDVSVGGEFTHLIDCLGDLEMFDSLLTNSNLDTVMKGVLREQLVTRFVESAAQVMESDRKSAIKSKRFRSELENYAAKVQGSGEDGQRMQNVIGSVRSKVD